MNRIAYMVLVVAVLAPPGHNAFGETMAERKQRIMRKYMRERQSVVQSDLEVPSAEEDERITESEKFIQPQADLTRNEASRPPAAPLVRPLPVQTEKNWLLIDADPDADPYADPFAIDEAKETDKSSADWLAEWRSRQEQADAQNQSSARSSAYGGYYSGDQSGSGYPQQRDGSSGYPYGNTQQRTYGGQSSGLGTYGTTRYGSSTSSEMLWPTQPSVETDGSVNSASGYTPYKSPYQTRRDQQQQQGYQSQPQPEYSRPTPYQKWKNDNKGWDPAADDAYLDELMQRNRR